MKLISIFKRKNHKKLFTTPSHDNELFIFHKFYQWYKFDISEVEAYNPVEALEASEKNASKIYNTKSTHYLTNGSTSGIIAAVLACCKTNDKILIWEHSHPCHKNAATLAGAKIIEYKLPYNKTWGIYSSINIYNLEELLKNNSPKAIIVTSPSYYGITSNIRAIKNMCNKYNTYLIVDEAHGALYPFSKKLPESAVTIADFTIQSLHKTAGGINPTALLHCNCDLNIKKALNMTNTTSPSYPMLVTIEKNIEYLNSPKGRKKIDKLIENINEIKHNINNIEFFGNDVTKILIKSKNLTGYQLSEKLFNEYDIEDEKTNEKSTMLLTGLGTSEKKLLKLKQALQKIDKELLD